MNKILIRELVGPMLARVGTAVSAYMVGNGISGSDAEKIAVGAVTLALVAGDLIVGHYFRKVQ